MTLVIDTGLPRDFSSMRKFQERPTLLLRSSDSVPLLEGIIDECRTLGWQIVNLAYTHDYVPMHPTPVGAILSYIPQDSTVGRLREARVPIVWTSQAQTDWGGAEGCVQLDRKSAGLLAGEVFAERGFKDWGYIAFSEDTFEDPLPLGLSQQAGMHEANLHVCHLEHLAAIAGQARKYEAQLDAIAHWLRESPRPLAVLAFNYTMSVRLIVACNVAGLSVPEQVAVACYGNSQGLSQTAPVPLSVIDRNLGGVGRQAVRLVKRLAAGEPPPRKPIQVPVKGFIERRSTDILAVSDPRVAKGVRFIWDHVAEHLMVDDVAREVGVSRSMLERLFRVSLNRGVNAELRRKRLELCKELLRGTSMTLADIARATGLNSTRHVHRSFKTTFGMTPTQYRKSLREKQ